MRAATRLVTLIAIILLLPAMLGARAAEEVDLLLVLSSDVSRSIDTPKFKLQRDGYAAAIVNPRVVQAIRSGALGKIGVSFVEWSGVGAQKIVIDWTIIHDEASAKDFAAQVIEAPRAFADRTSISGGIDFAVAQLARSPYQAARRTIDISGDGNNNSGRDATFSTRLIHLDHVERGPDIVLTFPWSSAKNAFGVPGTDYTDSRGATGPLKGNAGNHGSMSPWTVRNTFLAWGVDFKRGVTVHTPVSNVDITPTLIALIGLDSDPNLPPFDGRAITEALVDGPGEEQVATKTTTYFTATPDGAFRAAIQVSEVAGERYLDKSWRVR